MRYPLYFQYFDEIRTDDWTAFVRIRSKCLMEMEDDAWWLEGVQPGGLVGNALTPQAAQAEFRRSWRSVLEDFASEAPSAVNFRARVEKYFRQISIPAERDWLAAREEIRRAGLANDDPFKDMPKVTEDIRPLIQVQAFEHEVEIEIPNESEGMARAA